MTSMRYGPVQLSSPPGFQNILRLISQEVLRVQPENTVQFIAAFSKDLLEIRDNTGYDPVVQGDLIERVKEQYHKLNYDRQRSLVEATVSEATAASLPSTDQQALSQSIDVVTGTSKTITNTDDHTADDGAVQEKFYQATDKMPEKQPEDTTDRIIDDVATPSTDVGGVEADPDDVEIDVQGDE